jgi:hypothetical protein
MPSRWWVEVVATHRPSGQVIKYINTHMNTGVQPHGSDTSDPATGAYQAHMNSILGAVENTEDDMPLFCSADWNVKYDNRRAAFYPTPAFARNHMVSNWSYDRSNNPSTTLKDGQSLFDQVYHRKMAAVRFKGDMLVKNSHSDHFGVLVSYGLQAVDI